MDAFGWAILGAFLLLGAVVVFMLLLFFGMERSCSRRP